MSSALPHTNWAFVTPAEQDITSEPVSITRELKQGVWTHHSAGHLPWRLPQRFRLFQHQLHVWRSITRNIASHQINYRDANVILRTYFTFHQIYDYLGLISCNLLLKWFLCSQTVRTFRGKRFSSTRRKCVWKILIGPYSNSGIYNVDSLSTLAIRSNWNWAVLNAKTYLSQAETKSSSTTTNICRHQQK